MISTLLFGTFMKPVQNCLVPPTTADSNEYANTKDEIEKAEILRFRKMESLLGEAEDLDEKKEAVNI